MKYFKKKILESKMVKFYDEGRFPTLITIPPSIKLHEIRVANPVAAKSQLKLSKEVQHLRNRMMLRTKPMRQARTT